MRGLLPLSADPVTYGHLDIITRAAQQCDQLLVVLLPNPGKSYVLPEKERLSLLKECIAENPENQNVTVVSSTTPLMDLYLREGCEVLFRGIRNTEDREYETQQIEYHKMSCPDVNLQVVYLEADRRLKHIQSTVVRNFALNNFLTTDMAPMKVQARLWRHLNGQKTLGIFGTKGCGKTTVAKAIEGVVQAAGIPVTRLDVKELEQELFSGTSPGEIELQKKIEGSNVLFDEGTLRLQRAHLHRIYREKIKGKKGLILLEDFVGKTMFPYVNNNVLIVRSDLDSLETFPEEAPSQFEAVQKLDKYGTILTYEHKKDEFPNEAGELVLNWIRKGDF